MKKNGFTVAEMMIALCMIGVICAIVLPVMKFYTPDYKKAMFRKTYAITEDIVAKMINDDRFYPVEDEGFAYTTYAEAEGLCFGRKTKDDGSCGDLTPGTKFRDVFRYYLGEAEDIERDGISYFETDDNIIWDIPSDHDFSSGDITVSFYVKDNDIGNDKERFEIYISKNGRITVPDCEDDEQRCEEVKMLKSKDIMKDKK